MRESAEQRAFRAFEHETHSTIDRYLNQDPRPSIRVMADFLGVGELVETKRRGNARSLNIPTVKEAVVRRLWETKGATAAKLVLPECLGETVTPPDEGEIRQGRGNGVEVKEIIPRTQYLVEFLTEHHISFEQPIGGTNRPGMVRGSHSYFFFFLPEHNIAISVNNQKGNATFVFYHVPDRDRMREVLTPLKKSEYNDNKKNPHPFKSVRWTDDPESWKLELFDALTELPVEDQERRERNAQDRPTPPRKKRGKDWTRDRAIAAIEEAYEEWSRLPEETRGRFNSAFLEKNELTGLVRWARKKQEGGVQGVIRGASAKVQEAFQVRKEAIRRTREIAVAELEDAYRDWCRLADRDRRKFNSTFLKKSGYGALVEWARRNGGFRALVTHASEEVQQALKMKRPKTYRTQETALKDLETAYDRWSQTPRDQRGAFNREYLNKHAPGLDEWALRHDDGIRALLARAPQNVQEAFSIRPEAIQRTTEDARDELQRAYNKWKGRPQATRGPFHGRFLTENGFAALYQWLRADGREPEAFIREHASQEVRDAFTVRRRKKK